MRIKNITVGIRPLEAGLSDFSLAVRSIRRGRPPRARKDAVYFVDLDAMRRVLTPRRLELLRLVREKSPGSVYELALLARRDFKNVQNDLGLLARIGLVNLRRTQSSRRPVVPRVGYDRLQLQIPII